MKSVVSVLLLSVWLVCLLPYALYGQQAEAPVYKDGDWWRVKVETVFKAGVSRSGRCNELYPEYVVKIDQGKPKVFSVSDNKEEEIRCSGIANELLNIGQEAGRYLKFPLALNSSWTFQLAVRLNIPGVESTRWFNENHNVAAWEKVQISKGEFDAFKIEAFYPTRAETSNQPITTPRRPNAFSLLSRAHLHSTVSLHWSITM